MFTIERSLSDTEKSRMKTLFFQLIDNETRANNQSWAEADLIAKFGREIPWHSILGNTEQKCECNTI
jgi:hypothetical protein